MVSYIPKICVSGKLIVDYGGMKVKLVTPKNTKQEILEAYDQLLASLKEQKESFQDELSQEKTPLLSDFRARVLARIDEIEKEELDKREEVIQLNKQIEELQKEIEIGSKIRISLDELRNLHEKIDEERRDWERRKVQLEREASDDARWQKDRLQAELDQGKWEFQKDFDEKLRDLEEKERAFNETLKEYEELKEKVSEIPAILEKEGIDKEKQAKEELTKEFANEKIILAQKYEFEKNLLGQKISDLEARLKTQYSEAESLRSQLSKAQEQIKEMAVAALNREPQEPKPSGKVSK